jgi:hypothetical protein
MELMIQKLDDVKAKIAALDTKVEAIIVKASTPDPADIVKVDEIAAMIELTTAKLDAANP